MKRLILGISLLGASIVAFPQKLYFLYLQTDPAQPFFVRVDDKIYTSSSSGYLILSRLRDTVYTIRVGFPGNKWPEQRFELAIQSKDHGYLLRNYGEKGWGLYNRETMATKMAESSKSAAPKTEAKNVSAFTEVLSKAANDPSLKERPVLQQEEKPPVKKEEPKVAAQPPPVTEEKKEADPVIKQETTGKPSEEYRRSVVTRLSESSTSEGFGLTFLDDYGSGRRDTIKIIIPNPRQEPENRRERPMEEKKFLDISVSDTTKKAEDAGQQAESDSIVTREPASGSPQNDCPVAASEDDFLKLRQKMAGERGDDNMVDEARKQFKSRCFTVMQVKNLSALFLEDAGKYKFFDAAYLHVSDPENFPSLADELKDAYYLNRFKAMLR